MIFGFELNIYKFNAKNKLEKAKIQTLIQAFLILNGFSEGEFALQRCTMTRNSLLSPLVCEASGCTFP